MVSSELDLVSHSGQMVADDPSSSTGSISPIGKLTVSYSGESIIYAPQDANGNTLTVSSIRNSDDVQLLSLIGVGQATSFTLGLGHQTTAPIPLSLLPPLTSFVWAGTLAAPGQYDIAMAWGWYGTPPGGSACAQAQVDVFDGTTKIASIPLDQTHYPDPSVDIVVPNVGIFKSLGTFTFSTPNLQLNLSGAPNTGTLLAATIQVVPHGSTSPAAIGYVDPTPNRASGSDVALEGRSSYTTCGGWQIAGYYSSIANWHAVYYATPTGTQPTYFPKVADLQSGLQALTSIPAGGVQVTALSNQVVSIHFTGPLSARAMPTLVSSSPTFAVTHDNTGGSAVGGQFPNVTVNGTSYPLQAVSYAAGQPYLVYHLIQDAPDVQYCKFDQGLSGSSGYFNTQVNVGFAGSVGYPTAAGLANTWRFQGLPGNAEYGVAITWPAGDSNADILECIIQDQVGNVLATVTGIDQSQAPNDFQEGGVGWKNLAQFTLLSQSNNVSVLAINKGTANKHLLLDSVRLSRISARQSTQIKPTDHVLFSAPAGFLTTSNGLLPAVQNLVVNPAGSSRLPALPTTPKTLKLGTNLDSPNYYGTDCYFANVAIQTNVPLGQAPNAAGVPTRLAFDGNYGCGAASAILTQPPIDAGGVGLGVPSYGNGIWVVQWQGSAWNACLLRAFVSSTTVTEDVSRRVVGSVNRRYFQVTESYQNSPFLLLALTSTQQNADGSYACDISNVAVFPPDVDPNQTSKWRPSFLKKFQGLSCLRFMDLFGTNNLNLSSFAHFPDPANFPLGYSARSTTIPIASIGPPTPDAYAENLAGTVIRVTTKVPHGLATGFLVRLRTTDGTSLGQVLGNAIDPSTGATTSTARAPIDPTDGYNGAFVQCSAHVIDATNLQMVVSAGSGPIARMTNTLTPANGVVYADLAVGAMMAPSDAADLCATLGIEPWVNIPWLADDNCVTQMAQAFAARIPRGTAIHVEYGNEAWNYTFAGFYFSVCMNNLAGTPGINYIPYYVTRMSQVHKLFQAAWTAAGRNVSEVRRVCGTQYDNAGGTTAPIVQFAIANGITFDELAPACYYSNAPAAGSNDDLLTREQLLDLFAVNLQQGGLVATMQGHTQIMASALAQNPTQTWLGNVVLVNYEGGPEKMVTPTMGANIASRSQGVHRDPDFCEIELNHLQMLENAGVKLFNIFTLYGTRDVQQWGVYEGSQMVAGTGDATIDLANRNDFENLPAIKSETAAALVKWAALIQKPISTATKLRNFPDFGLSSFGQEAF